MRFGAARGPGGVGPAPALGGAGSASGEPAHDGAAEEVQGLGVLGLDPEGTGLGVGGEAADAVVVGEELGLGTGDVAEVEAAFAEGDASRARMGCEGGNHPSIGGTGQNPPGSRHLNP